MYPIAIIPDIMFAISLLSRFMHCTNESHFKAIERVLRYVKDNIDHGIWFTKSDKSILYGFVDSD